LLEAIDGSVGVGQREGDGGLVDSAGHVILSVVSVAGALRDPNRWPARSKRY
jgi:hypothetical protein